MKSLRHGLALAAYVAALPKYEIQRRLLQRRRTSHSLDVRERHLQERFGCRAAAEASCRLVDIDPILESRVAQLREGASEIVLADIDQDGQALPRFGSLWDAATVDAADFLARSRRRLSIVDRGGQVGVRKEFAGDAGPFLSEIEAALDLRDAGCRVPAILAIDWNRRAIVFEFIRGSVIRETLARAGVPLLDRQVERPGSRAAVRRIQQAARKIISTIFDADSIDRIAAELLAVHRAGYALTDVKYGNIIIEQSTDRPWFVDFEAAVPLAGLGRALSNYIRDHDVRKFNAFFGTDLPLASHQLPGS